MKKKVLSLVLATAMVASTFAGMTANAEEEGKVLNIRVWNTEFQERLVDHYPGYEKVDDTHGKIGDVDVVWNVTPTTDNAYQNALDEALLAQADAAADDKVDMFLVEADYILKYTDSEYAMPIADLGITDDETAQQFQYVKDLATDSNGVLKGLSWQAAPAVLIYRRDMATEVLGSDDPETVQAAVADWDTFLETAGKMKEAGYKMTAGAADTFRVFSDNVTSKWVEDGKINIDDNIMKWVSMSKEMVDNGYTTTAGLWSDDWSKGFYEDGDVFCYFGPAWFFDFSMAGDAEGSVGINGGWAVTKGPQAFSWGGTWLCAATGTDNATLVADIMRQLTCNADIMTEIATLKGDFVNNQGAMEALAADESFGDAILGGQNPIPMFLEGVTTIDRSNICNYDQGCTESFQTAMNNYFDGNATLEEAIELFNTSVLEKYPELTPADVPAAE